MRALREIPDDARGWQTEKRTVQCQSCKAVSVFDPERVGQRCEFCGSPKLVDYQEIKSPIRPQSLLPFRVADTAVREQIRNWYKSKWLAPGSLKSRALVDTVKGIYIPYWTFDAQVALPVGSRRGALLLHDGNVPRQQGTHPDAAGPSRPVGAGLRRRRSFLRRRADSRHARRFA